MAFRNSEVSSCVTHASHVPNCPPLFHSKFSFQEISGESEWLRDIHLEERRPPCQCMWHICVAFREETIRTVTVLLVMNCKSLHVPSASKYVAQAVMLESGLFQHTGCD